MTISAKKKEDIIAKFEERWSSSRTYLNEAHRIFDEGVSFINGAQWDSGDENLRTSDPNNPRPCLVFNKTKRIAKRIANGVRQANLGFKAVPVDNGADPLIAELYNTLIKKIEQDNNSVSVRQAGFESALFGGIGFWRIYDDWEADDSLEKKIVVKRIVNPKSVSWDKSSIEPDLSDSEWFAIHTRMSLDSAKRLFPNVDWEASRQVKDCAVDWDDKDEALVVEYFYYDYKPCTLVRVGNETLCYEDMEEADQQAWDTLPKSHKEANSRKSQKRVVMWCKMAGRDFAEEPREFESRYLPIVFCPGDEYWDGDKRKWGNVATMLKDAQRLYNFYRSTQQERLTIADDAPWLITLESVQGLETTWKRAHLNRTRYLPYNHKDDAGQLLPPPQRSNPIIGDAGLDQEVMRLDQEMLDMSGVNLNTLGEQGNETSGKAILARTRQGEMINAHYVDSFQTSIRYEGKVIIDMIPRVYPWEKAIKIVGQDKADLIKQLQSKGLLGWGNGRYDLEVEVGSTTTTQKQEEREFWTQAIQANPAMAPLVMDVLVETIGSSKAKLLSQRFKAMLPPQVQGITDSGLDGPAPEVAQAMQQVEQVKQQAQQAMQGMGQQLQAATQEIQAAKSDTQVKQMELQLKGRELELKTFETQARLEIERRKLQIEEMKLAQGIRNDDFDKAARVYEATKPDSESSDKDESGTERAESRETM